ncbi:MAG: molecular chaperone DnaJ, partial [Thauera sp.]|nr:molecular chaperone DnaJ [Thauera sp.]
MAINRLFFRGTTAPTVAVASPQVALVTVPVVHEVTPEISREPTPDLPPAVLPEAAAHATAEASAEASPEETPEVSAEAPAGVTELVPVPERHDTTRLEDDPVAPAAIAAAPDPDAERLLARCARLQAQMLDFTARLADMEQQVRSYEQHQFLALGDVVGECLRLRQEYL